MLLRNFYEGLDKYSAFHLDVVSRGSFSRMTLAEGRKFLYDIIDSIAITIMPKVLRKICKSNLEDLLVVKSNLSSSTSLDSALETSPEPGTSQGEEIHRPKFSSRFEDESTGNYRNTWNLIDAHSGKEPSSVHTINLEIS